MKTDSYPFLIQITFSDIRFFLRRMLLKIPAGRVELAVVDKMCQAQDNFLRLLLHAAARPLDNNADKPVGIEFRYKDLSSAAI